MGPRAPCWFGRGDVTLHKEQTSVGKHDKDHTGSFTQVQTTMRRKTLLLLWWIVGGRMVVERNTLALQGASGRLWLRAYQRVGVQPSNPFYGCHGPPFID